MIKRLLPRRPQDFYTQLTVLISIGIVALALGTSIVTGLLLNRQLESLLTSYVLQATEQLAANSAIAFFATESNVQRRPAASFLEFPGIESAMIFDQTDRLIVRAGRRMDWAPPRNRLAWGRRPEVLAADDFMHFVAPVSTAAPTQSPFEESTPNPEQLGYVQVAWSKRPLRWISMMIFGTNLVLSCFFAALLIVWFRRRVSRLTGPLSALALEMQRARIEAGPARAVLSGPRETREIGVAFNALVAELETQQATLESQVEERTLQLADALEKQAQSFAMFSHDMRSPLHAIMGHAQLMLETLSSCDKKEQERNRLERILRAASYLLVRINQILDLAKLERGQLPVHRTDTDLEHIVTEAFDVLESEITQRQNTFTLEVKGDMNVITDAEKVAQIVHNLIENACKFTEGGEINVHLRRAGDAFEIQVKDTGIGISTAEQATIFQAFHQIDMSDTRRYPGAGLGLTVASEFARVLGGSIAVDSRLTEGATFTVSIPLTHD